MCSWAENGRSTTQPPRESMTQVGQGSGPSQPRGGWHSCGSVREGSQDPSAVHHHSWRCPGSSHESQLACFLDAVVSRDWRSEHKTSLLFIKSYLQQPSPSQ